MSLCICLGFVEHESDCTQLLSPVYEPLKILYKINIFFQKIKRDLQSCLKRYQYMVCKPPFEYMKKILVISLYLKYITF